MTDIYLCIGASCSFRVPAGLCKSVYIFLRVLENKCSVCLHALISYVSHVSNHHQTDLQVHRDNHNLRFKRDTLFYAKYNEYI